MKIKKLEVDGFRCLQDFCIAFEDDLTIVVGENDCGKTSLVDCLKIITQNKPVEIDDFSYGANRIVLSIEIEDFVFDKVYEKQNEVINPLPMKARPSLDFLTACKSQLESGDFDIQVPNNAEIVKYKARLFGFTVRANSNVANLRQAVLERIDQHLADETLRIENAQFPNFNNIQLDGKQFENVSLFFKEVFLKEKQSDIWKEKIDAETSLEDFIRTKIDGYSDEISTKMNESGIKDKIRMFLKNLTDIRVEPIYQARDLNIDAKVKFLESGREINLQKKGDGTKRRITMALLEFKKEQDRSDDDSTTIYLLDEPDTHLHVRAQLELIETLEAFSKNGNQVIITTHSPFIMNSVNPSQIRLLLTGEHGATIAKSVHDQPNMPVKVLQSIGVENVYLFFARTIVIVEGATEENFIENYFFRRTHKTISCNLIKIINTEGIHNIVGFARGVLELHNPEKIYVVCDNDASPELQQLINELNISDQHKHVIGQREFEDAFCDEVLFDCWKQYHELHQRDCPQNWTVENIRKIRGECHANPNTKFSQRLRELSAGGKKMTKPIFGSALAALIKDEDLPPQLSEVLSVLHN